VDTYTTDCIVVGAGVIGLAVARRLAQLGREVLLLESEDKFGRITSSRNSEVIHAGLYYPPGSRKARLCVRGRELLYEYCERYGVPHRRCGKLIVANGESQRAELLRILATACSNGVHDLLVLERSEVRSLEPSVRCTAALLSPSSGIFDTQTYMLSLLAQAETAGASIALRTRVERLVVEKDGISVIAIDGNGEQLLLEARCVVNSAGLGAPEIAARTTGLPERHCPRSSYAKGSYFTLRGRAPFSRLIYPIPEPGGLGIHLTLDMASQARFGPDVQWVDEPDYAVDLERVADFYRSIRHYWPDLRDGALEPGYAGVRPKIAGHGESASDFRIDGPETHGVDGLVNLFGIESPGLTASLAIAEHVGELVHAQR
jgi:L-2-hydroxyglutarate oxidase LhgO